MRGNRPYIDGRAEMYGDAFVMDYWKILHGDMGRFNMAVDRYDIRWTILPNSEKRLIKAVKSSPDWRRMYSDDIGVIDVRTPLSKDGYSGLVRQ